MIYIAWLIDWLIEWLIRNFLHLLPPGVGEKEVEKLEQETPEFQIDELFEVR